jgi:hypothetical protein
MTASVVCEYRFDFRTLVAAVWASFGAVVAGAAWQAPARAQGPSRLRWARAEAPEDEVDKIVRVVDAYHERPLVRRGLAFVAPPSRGRRKLTSERLRAEDPRLTV